MSRPTFDSLPPEAWSEPAESAASPPADPQSTDTPTVPPAEATPPPAPGQVDGEAPQDSGPIPFDRHKAILETERQKRTDLDAKWQRVQWADALVDAGKTPEQIQEALGLFDSIRGNPIEFLGKFHDLLRNDPEYGQSVRSWAGKVLGGGRQPVEAVNPQGDPEPGPDFQDEKGTPFFSAPQLQKWQTWRERQFEAKQSERYQPLIDAHQQAQAAEQQRQSDARDTQRAISEVDKIKAKPFYDELKPDIAARMKESNWTESPLEAYVAVLTTKKLPTLTADAKAQTLAELKTHAAASSAKPSTAASATPTKPRSFNDPSLKW